MAYAHLQQAVYPAIKSVDPSAIVLSAPIAPHGQGLTGVGGSGSSDPYNFLTAAYRAGLRGSFDVLAWNLYPPGAPEDAFDGPDGHPYPGTLPGLLYVRTILDQYDPGRHVWVTELGWSSCSGCAENNLNGVDQTIQADYLSRAFIYRSRYLADFVDRIFWYRMQDGPSSSAYLDNLGLVRYDGSRKPAFDALANVDQASAPNGGSSSPPAGAAPSTPAVPPSGSAGAPPAGSPPAAGAAGAPFLPPGGSGSAAGVAAQRAKISCAGLKQSLVLQQKTALALTTPRIVASSGKLALSVTATVVRKRVRLLLDGYRVTRWVPLAQRWLTRPSRLEVTVRDRGYIALRVRVRQSDATSWQACAIARVLTAGG